MKDFSYKDFATKLKKALEYELPGSVAHEAMNPARDFLLNDSIIQVAAVLIVLYRQGNNWTFPLIKRAEDEYPHSGQIALPGGRLEPDESPSAAACREAEEEIGLPADKISILGKLTPITIPVSGFLVHPFVGIIDFEPIWIPNPTEVDFVIPASLHDLHASTNRKIEQRIFNKKSTDIRYFQMQNQKVWGATAMILNEFRLVSRLLF